MTTIRLVHKPALAASAMLTATVVILGFVLSYTAVKTTWVEAHNLGSPFVANGDSFVGSLAFILARNLSAGALLYSGAVSAGATSLLTSALVAAYVGATFKVGVTASGLLDLLRATGLYLPLEFGGCFVAAVAGVYPAARATLSSILPTERTAYESPTWLANYVGSIQISLALLAIAAVLIFAGAVVEASLIVSR